MSHRWCLTVALTAVWLLAPVAQAQPRLDSSILQTTSALSAEQQRVVEEFVTPHLRALTEGDDRQVLAARDALLSPFTAGGTTQFQLGYSSAISRRLAPAIQSDRPIVALNAMIIASRLVDSGAVELVQLALRNQTNTAVRYWAGKTVLNTLSARQNVPVDEQRTLLGTLIAAAAEEQSLPVLRQLMLGVAGLTIPEANAQLLDLLNRRVALHAQQPELSIGPERETLRQVFSKLVRDEARDPNAQNVRTALRDMARVSFRYLDLSAKLLLSDKVSGQTASEYAAIIRDGEQFLQWTLGKLATGVPRPASMVDAVGRRDWALLQLRVAEWRRLLAENTGIPGNQLDAPEPR